MRTNHIFYITLKPKLNPKKLILFERLIMSILVKLGPVHIRIKPGSILEYAGSVVTLSGAKAGFPWAVLSRILGTRAGEEAEGGEEERRGRRRSRRSSHQVPGSVRRSTQGDATCDNNVITKCETFHGWSSNSSLNFYHKYMKA